MSDWDDTFSLLTWMAVGLVVLVAVAAAGIGFAIAWWIK